jgi:hypothetical protein
MPSFLRHEEAAGVGGIPESNSSFRARLIERGWPASFDLFRERHSLRWVVMAAVSFQTAAVWVRGSYRIEK